ncbi:hypothetical protein [Mesoterricola silvestris]|uniref:Uncharacterized protein n=1 Tax=Mesoterricola silvestris TaxID=2927979 RepID=A0AA48GYI9_9BACT|nr:hypothetical protein [Mesoterricola silvestris]BDU72718.1 hypothetical protein METEAL_18920 [Mesoterricola silvestris]
MRRAAVLLLAALSGAALAAQEISAGAGRLHGIGGKAATYTWQLQYLRKAAAPWGWSLTWINEGHLPGHHQDGVALQVWRLHRMEHNNLNLGLGLGVYRTFDTFRDAEPDSYGNGHALKPILSLRARYPIRGGPWDAFVQVNRTLGPEQRQTQAALVGLGTRFGTQAPAGPALPKREREAPANELSFLFGRTILNSFESEATEFLQSFAVEYRRRLSRHVDLSFTYCDEGGIDAARRDGVAAQVWLSTRTPDRAWMLGFGAGPYACRTFPPREEGPAADTVNIRTSGRISMLVGRTLGGHWGARLQWNRTATRNHRDTDALLAGLAYAW